MDSRIVSKTYLPYPSHCALCGSVNRDCLDLGIDYPRAVEVDRRGAVLVCVNCFANLAKIMGYAKDKPLNNATSLNNDHIVSDAENRIRTARNAATELVATLDINLSSLRDYALILDMEATKEAEASRHDDASGQSTESDSVKEPVGVSSGSSRKSGKLADLLD